MKKSLFAMIAVVALMTATAGASVTILPQAYWVYADADGTEKLPASSLVAWVADMDGDGFKYDEITLDDTGLVADGDDVLLGISGSGAVDGFLNESPVWRDVAAQGSAGKEFAMVWFDTPYVDGASGVDAGVAYGVFTTGEVVPPDPSISVTMPLWSGSFTADYVATPEPATMALLTLGGLAMLRRRRSA